MADRRSDDSGTPPTVPGGSPPHGVSHGPPRLAHALLRRALHDDAYEAIAGDLEEEFRELRRRRGRLAARVWYWRHALRSIRSRPARARRAARRAPGLGASAAAFWERRVRDLRLAARQLARTPGVTAVALLALALGIGLTTTTFSVVRGSLLRGLPFERAAELVHFERENRDTGQASLAVTPHDFVAWRAAQTTFVDLGAYTDVLVLVGGEQVAAESHLAILIDRTSFDLLGVSPVIGRGFSPEDEQPGAPPVLLIGDQYWRTRLAGDPEVVGRSIRIDGIPTTVVGVMPPHFAFPIDEQLWMPLRLDFNRIARGAGRLDAFGRLLPGRTIGEARSEFDLISRNLQEAHPDTNAGVFALLQTFQEEYIGEQFTSLMLTMLAGAFLVLAIACANVANLLAARAAGRAREMAVRSALGAGRGRLFAQLLTEAAVLAAAGGLAGLALGWAGLAAFRAAWARGVPIGLPHGLSNGLFWWQFEIDTGVLAFVLGMTFLTSLIAGIAPALRAGRSHPWAALQSARGGAGRRTGRSSRALVVAQFALTAGLLVTAGLMVKSVFRTTTADQGLPVNEVLTARVQLLGAAGALPDNYPDLSSRLRFWDELVQRLAADSRASAIGLTTSLPMARAGRAVVRVRGQQSASVEPSAVVVSPGFFEIFDVAPLEGRLFADTDRADAPPVVIVNRALARAVFADRSPLGQLLRLGDDEAASSEPWVTVVGVVPDLWVDGERSEPAIYLPLQQSTEGAARRSVDGWGGRRLSVAVRTGGSPRALADSLRDTVADIDPWVPVGALMPMAEVVSGFTAQYQVYGAFYLVFGAVALVMATIGLYSVVAFAVSNRTAEIGVRMAMGADARRIAGLVLRQGALQIGAGMLAGAGLAVWLPFQLTGILFEVEPLDPAVLAGVIGVLVATGIVACWAPARRAARVDPLAAMRET